MQDSRPLRKPRGIRSPCRTELSLATNEVILPNAIAGIIVSIGLSVAWVPVARGGSALKSTTLSSAWVWAIGALTFWTATWIADHLVHAVANSVADHLWYACAVLALCPAIAVLGSRRPGTRVWNWFIQVPMLFVLGWPVLTLWLQGSDVRGLQLETPQLIAYLLVLVMGAGNYLGTRFTLASLCFAAANGLIVISSSAISRMASSVNVSLMPSVSSSA